MDPVNANEAPAASAPPPLPPVAPPVKHLKVVRAAARFTKRIKILIGAFIGLAIGLYDVVTAGGIDLNNVLTPFLGKYVDVGRMLATVSLLILLARFTMQNRIFQSAKKNGLDDPDDPENAAA